MPGDVGHLTPSIDVVYVPSASVDLPAVALTAPCSFSIISQWLGKCRHCNARYDNLTLIPAMTWHAVHVFVSFHCLLPSAQLSHQPRKSAQAIITQHHAACNPRCPIAENGDQQEALGIGDKPQFVACSDQVGAALGPDLMQSAANLIPEILDHVPLLLYAGEQS